jgi:hypothetical protein
MALAAVFFLDRLMLFLAAALLHMLRPPSRSCAMRKKGPPYQQTKAAKQQAGKGFSHFDS